MHKSAHPAKPAHEQVLGWLIDTGIAPHIPVWEKSDRQDGIFSRWGFRWDRKCDVYICPNGKLLYTSGTVHDGRTLLYRASKRDGDVCPIRAKCCTNADARKIPRDHHEDGRDVAGRKMKTQAFARSREERKRVEMSFAHLKTHGFERMLLRGLSGARGPPAFRTWGTVAMRRYSLIPVSRSCHRLTSARST